MKITLASHKAIKYACLNFHYAKRMPVNVVGYNVHNDKDEWCGVIVFGAGVEGIEKPFKLPKNSVWELVRVALNGKQELTSKAVSIAVRLFKNDAPAVKLLVSYADSDQGHAGTIYQAMNWNFIGSMKTSDRFTSKETGASIHSRQISRTGTNQQFGMTKKCYSYDEVIREKAGLKHKYIFPLHKLVIPMCKAMSKPYPKKEADPQAIVAQEVVR